MKSIFFTTLFLLNSVIFAQNLVPNPDFEDYSILPDLWGQWDRCNYWTNAGGIAVSGFYADPDYFHVNGSGTVQLPSTSPAYLDPYSGDAVMGFLGYHDPGMGGTDIREYIQCQLISPLVVGEFYEVSFYITNGFNSIGHYYEIDGLGVNFSVDPLIQNNASYIDRAPQLEIDSSVFTTQWSQVVFIFEADSTYEYLTIGNFYNDANTIVTTAVFDPVPFAGAYYYIDKFVVKPTTEVAKTSNKQLDLNIQLFPNPTSDLLNISTGELFTDTEYTIYNVEGKLIENGLFTGHTSIDISTYENGTYFIEVATNELRDCLQFVKE